MDNKIKLILIFAGAAVVITLAVIFFFSQANSNTVPIQTATGEVIPVRNFHKNPVEQSKSTIAIAETPDYQIINFTKDNSFAITLLTAPVQTARVKAENAFLQNLQIDKGSACKLHVAMKVPYNVDPNLAGPDYGLSFCPNGKIFPQ